MNWSHIRSPAAMKWHMLSAWSPHQLLFAPQPFTGWKWGGNVHVHKDLLARTPQGKKKASFSSKALHGDENVTREVMGINLLEDEAAGEF